MTKLIDSPVNLIPTHVEGVDFIVRFRYASGRKLPIPYFRVSLNKEMQQINGCKYAYVSIAKFGWALAWKKSLVSLTANKGRRKVVRFMGRPPQKESFSSVITINGLIL